MRAFSVVVRIPDPTEMSLPLLAKLPSRRFQLNLPWSRSATLWRREAWSVWSNDTHLNSGGSGAIATGPSDVWDSMASKSLRARSSFLLRKWKPWACAKGRLQLVVHPKHAPPKAPIETPPS